MIHVSFELDKVTATEAQQVVKLLHAKYPEVVEYTAQRVSTVVTLDPTQPVSQTLSASSAQPDISIEPQPEAKRRGRPRKEAQPEVPAVDPTPAQNGSAEGAAPSAEPLSQSAPAGETGPKSYTLDELRSGLQTYTGKHDLVKAKALLKSFGCDRITELAEKGPEVHRQFMKECEA